MGAFGDARGELAGTLTAGGVEHVTVDPAAGVPFVLVDAVTVVAAAGVGAWSSTVPIKIVGSPPGDATTLAWLEDQLEAVLRAVGFAPAFPGRYTTTGGVECPSYTVTFPLDVPNPDC